MGCSPRNGQEKGKGSLAEDIWTFSGRRVLGCGSSKYRGPAVGMISA